MSRSPITVAAPLALALAACTGVATAQNSVTIYGVVDVGISKSNNGTSLNPGRGTPGAWVVQQGNASRLGFKGREELGGGLYASFDIQHRFFADTGTVDSGSFWKGVSVVALGSKALGEVYLGREVIPAYYLTCTADPTCWSYTSQPGQPFAWANYNGSVASDNSGIRRNNSVGYRSPVFGGLSTELAVAAGEGQRRRSLGGNVQYNGGPVYAAIGFDGVDSDNRLVILAGGYDFGFVRPLVTFSDAQGGPTTPEYEGRSATLTFVVPTATGRVFAGAGRLEATANAASTEVRHTKFYVGADHNLSKRTMLYANLGTAKSDGLTRSTAYDAGIRHKF